jgi:hypothetical protein
LFLEEEKEKQLDEHYGSYINSDVSETGAMHHYAKEGPFSLCTIIMQITYDAGSCVMLLRMVLVTFSMMHVRLFYKPYFFYQPTIFFSHNKSANSTFTHDFSDQREPVYIKHR